MSTLPRAAAVALVLALGAGGARAASSDACARAYESAQETRLEGRLRAAHEHLLVCAQAACPGFIRDDCTRWLDQVEAAVPTVVFVARQAGRDLEDVTITCNEQRLTSRLDGRAIPLDPGKQTCRFESAGAEPATLSLLAVEGQKNRLVEVELKAGVPAPAVMAARPAPAPTAGLRPAPLVLAGVAALGVGGFIALGSSGMAAERRLRDGCAPDCAASEVSSVRLRYRLADVSLGVGLLSAVAAGYLYWRGRPDERPIDVAVTVGQGGGTLLVGSSY